MIAEARPSVDETLLHVAYAWSRRGTCSRAYVGAVLAIDGRTVASGYNGAPRGMSHCDCVPSTGTYVGHDALGAYVGNDTTGCPVSVHAEANAVAFAARNGIPTEGATLYTTLMPCRVCAALLVNAGVVRVVAVERYRDRAGEDLLRAAGVVVQLADDLEV